MVVRVRQAVGIVFGAASVLCIYLMVKFAIDAGRGGTGDLGREGTVLFMVGSALVAVVFGLGAWASWPRRRPRASE